MVTLRAVAGVEGTLTVRRGPHLADGVSLRAEEFRLLRDLLAARTGLQFGPEARFTLERRLRERLVVLNMTSFSEYHHYLRFSAGADAEWDEVVDLLTTNETYFFREERQLRAFRNEILPMMQAQTRQQRRLTFWSAGCSTGEEVYTLSILVHQSGLFYPRLRPGTLAPRSDGSSAPAAAGGLSTRRELPPWDVRFYGSDISRRCVAVARRAVYGESSFRATTDEQRREFFVERPDGWQVADVIRQSCHFGQMNLLDVRSPALPAVGRVDVIFCRNVLIYFDARARKTAIEVLYDRLNPGGILLLGHSESLLNVSTAFELLHLKDDLVYRRPLTASGASQRLDELK